jgi:ATP-dependent DNA ligase
VKKEADPAARKYEDFLNSKKQEVDKELKMQRTNSSEKRLSANKSRVTSPSPKKKRWEDSGQEEEKPAPKLAPAPAPAPVLKPAESEKKQKISLTTPNMRPPMIPHSKPLPVTVITTTAAKEPKVEPKKTESAKDPSPRLEETLPLIDTVNSSVTSLP